MLEKLFDQILCSMMPQKGLAEAFLRTQLPPKVFNSHQRISCDQAVSDSESSTSASAATEIVQPNSFLEEVQQQTAEEVDLSRVVVVFGDHNTVNLPLSTSELPVSTVVCSLGGSTLSEIRQKVKDGNIPDLLIVDRISCYISPYLGLCLAPLILHES